MHEPIKVPWPKVTEIRDRWHDLCVFCFAVLDMNETQVGQMLYPQGNAEDHRIFGMIARRVILSMKASRARRRYFGTGGTG